MKPFEQTGIGVGVGTLFGSLPELLLRRVAIHGTYFYQAICTQQIKTRHPRHYV